MTQRPSILCVLRIPPAANGHGGAQRAWRLVAALGRLGRVDLVLLHRPTDRDLDTVSLEPVRALVASLSVVAVPEWDSIKHRRRHLPWRLAQWIDLARIGSAEAPRLPRRALRSIAAALPGRTFDVVVAGRLPCAVIVDRLIAGGALDACRRVVDLDDILSAWKRRQRAESRLRLAASLLLRLDTALVARAERRLVCWDAVGLCSDDDAAAMAAVLPETALVTVPNVIDRPLLPLAGKGGFDMLFVGNLAFPPNRHGLERFVEEAWPLVRARRPDATLTVVGLAPPDALRAQLARAGAALHADVPDTLPFYRAAQVVVCPIFFGGGTRIKLLEAIAHGRAIVATTIGAAGLGLEPGRHACIANTLPAFADALLRLADDPGLRDALAAQARTLQQQRFTPTAFEAAVARMIAASDA